MPRAWCQESCARHFSILGSGYHLGAVRATQQREHTSPSLPKESSETHATKSPGNPAVAGTVAKKRTASLEQSSTPAPSKERFRMRSGRKTLAPARATCAEPGP